MALRAILVSFGVHAGVAVGMVAGSGGHAALGAPQNVTLEVVDIETATETVPESPTPAKVEETLPVAPSAPPPTHTHPYPVPFDHDAKPHDPSQPHDHASDHAEEHSAAAEAPAVATAAAAAPMPVFAMSTGGGTLAPGATRVAGDARGSGNGSSLDGDHEHDHAHAHADETYGVNAVSAPAKLVASALAAYPPAARADDVEGDVGLEIVVDAGGNVVDARVIARAGHGFDDAALAAIKRYRFSPASREGRSVRVRMPWTVQFRLR